MGKGEEMNLQLMIQRYIRYRDWARRSGYAAMDWPEYKRMRAAHYTR